MNKNKSSMATLNDQQKIPYLGLGTWQATGNDGAEAVTYALTHGYDHIDTAQIYGNEAQVAEGWQASGRPRDEIFITTKIWNMNQGTKRTRRSLEKSLKRLQTDYVDLCLIHWPNVGNFQRTRDTWTTLIELRDEGKCRSIGVSNFTVPLLKKLMEETDVVPAVNQVEFHPFLYQEALLNTCRDMSIQIEAYSPLARAKFMENNTLKDIAQKYDKSVAQVMLAWGLHHDLVILPKSVHKDRIEENADSFFSLNEEDLQILDNIKPQKRLIKPNWAPTTW